MSLPLAGEPRQEIVDAKPTNMLYVTGGDYHGMKPTFHVKPGDRVLNGQRLFEDKKNPGVFFTSPGTGIVKEILRGEKRTFRQIVVERSGDEDAIAFEQYPPTALEELSVEQVKKNLLDSGLWTALRTRPYSRIPAPDSLPNSLFVTAIDTNPLAARPETIIEETPETKAAFVNGLKVLSRIAGKKLYLCLAPNSSLQDLFVRNMEAAVFDGPHPAGLPGTHIHFIDPVGQNKTVWHIGYQEVIAIGRLFTQGRLNNERVVSLAGPKVREPRLYRTHLGACLKGLTRDRLVETGLNRIISGSVLCGRTAWGHDVPEAMELPGLGRYHHQVSVIDEMPAPEFFGWFFPGFKKFSVTNLVVSSILPIKRFRMNTSMMGGHRAIFPQRQLDNVMPLDIMPNFLFRALEIGDLEQSEALGMLELDEEDLGLCTFVDPGKNDYTVTLRAMLETMLKEEQVP